MICISRPTWCTTFSLVCVIVKIQPFAQSKLHHGQIGCRAFFNVAFTFEERVMDQLVEGVIKCCAMIASRIARLKHMTAALLLCKLLEVAALGSHAECYVDCRYDL